MFFILFYFILLQQIFEMATYNLITNTASTMHWLTHPLKIFRNIVNHITCVHHYPVDEIVLAVSISFVNIIRSHIGKKYAIINNICHSGSW